MTSNSQGPSAPAALAGATAVLVASFLPWATSGERARTSYELTRVAVRFDLLPTGVAALAPIWYLVPALVGAAWLARSMDRRSLTSIFCVVVGLLSVVAAMLTLRSPLVTEAGTVLAMGSGLLAAGAGTMHLVTVRTHRDR
jgi:hypothetical protein